MSEVLSRCDGGPLRGDEDGELKDRRKGSGDRRGKDDP